eukprot:1446657-Alexandrium_andersonii.AAC.1
MAATPPGAPPAPPQDFGCLRHGRALGARQARALGGLGCLRGDRLLCHHGLELRPQLLDLGLHGLAPGLDPLALLAQ